MLESKNCRDKTDEELADLALKSEEYFECLIKRYQKKLLRYISRISGSNFQESQDILQDVFIKVYQNLNNFDSDLKFSSWIYRITHNQVINNYRRIKARPRTINLEDSDGFLSNLSDDSDPTKKIDLNYLEKDINRVLGKIDIKYREVLVLRFLEGKNYKEISDILRKPMGTVATLINRAKKEVKKEYEKEQRK